MQRRPKEHVKPLDLRLTSESQRLRKEAKGMPPGIELERLVHRARQSESRYPSAGMAQVGGGPQIISGPPTGR
jgi:hypothetical protein